MRFSHGPFMFWYEGFVGSERTGMETRVALIGIIVEQPEAVERMNHVLHEYSHVIIGRMGIPHRERGISVVSIVVDAPQDVISALSGKLGMIRGINSKAVYSKISKGPGEDSGTGK